MYWFARLYLCELIRTLHRFLLISGKIVIIFHSTGPHWVRETGGTLVYLVRKVRDFGFLILLVVVIWALHGFHYPLVPRTKDEACGNKWKGSKVTISWYRKSVTAFMGVCRKIFVNFLQIPFSFKSWLIISNLSCLYLRILLEFIYQTPNSDSFPLGLLEQNRKYCSRAGSKMINPCYISGFYCGNVS